MSTKYIDCESSKLKSISGIPFLSPRTSIEMMVTGEEILETIDKVGMTIGMAEIGAQTLQKKLLRN